MTLSQGAACGHLAVPRPAGIEKVEQGLGPFVGRGEQLFSIVRIPQQFGALKPVQVHAFQENSLGHSLTPFASSAAEFAVPIIKGVFRELPPILSASPACRHGARR